MQKLEGSRGRREELGQGRGRWGSPGRGTWLLSGLGFFFRGLEACGAALGSLRERPSLPTHPFFPEMLPTPWTWGHGGFLVQAKHLKENTLPLINTGE